MQWWANFVKRAGDRRPGMVFLLRGHLAREATLENSLCLTSRMLVTLVSTLQTIRNTDHDVGNHNRRQDSQSAPTPHHHKAQAIADLAMLAKLPRSPRWHHRIPVRPLREAHKGAAGRRIIGANRGHLVTI
jgi:hypothetical protein